MRARARSLLRNRKIRVFNIPRTMCVCYYIFSNRVLLYAHANSERAFILSCARFFMYMRELILHVCNAINRTIYFTTFIKWMASELLSCTAYVWIKDNVNF